MVSFAHACNVALMRELLWSVVRYIGMILPRRIWSKIKPAGAGRSGVTIKPDDEDIGPNSPGPCAFQAATDQYVERFVRSTATACIALLLDRRTA